MFLRCKKRKKDGKVHRYWSIVENRRISSGKTVQKHVLYLGEINDSQRSAWRKSIELFTHGQTLPEQVALFPEDRLVDCEDEAIIHIRVSEMSLHRPRQWGACWLAIYFYKQLQLDAFWQQRLGKSRKKTPWYKILEVLICYRLIDPGSEWRLHRSWYDNSAMADLLGEDFSLVAKSKLYECHDKLLAYKEDFFLHLKERWKDLFNPTFDVLLYDLTSTYFECEPDYNAEEPGLKRYGYSRDKRPDCLQVVIALVITPEGFPLAYEVMPGNTLDKTTLEGFLETIENTYGKARRTWIMDRGIPTEETLEKMRSSNPPVHYLVGTPRGRLNKLERSFLDKQWKSVRDGVKVKLNEQEDELYVLAHSAQRRNKERAIRQKQLRKLAKRLGQLQKLKTPLKRDDLLMKLGSARKEVSQKVWALLQITIPDNTQDTRNFTFKLNRKKFRKVWKTEGRYLLRSNLTEKDPQSLWHYYMQLTQIEESFKNLKGDLSIRPIYHQKDKRIEAHIFIAFMAYCLHVTIRERLKQLAPGLTPRSLLEKMKAIQMIDVHLPTTDNRHVVLSRYTEPEAEHKMLLQQLNIHLPEQPKPKIYSNSMKL